MAAISHAIARRRDIVFAHVLTAAVVSFEQCARLFGSAAAFWRQVGRAGFLVGFESLLSCYASERAQLEDLWDAVKALRHVSVRVVPHPPGADGGPLRILYHRRSYCVELHVAGRLAPEAFGAEPVAVVPVLVTQGIDEMQTFGHQFGELRLQQEINAEAANALRAYADAVAGDVESRVDGSRVSQLLGALGKAMDAVAAEQAAAAAGAADKEAEDREAVATGASSGKNVDVLLASEQLCRELRGGRVTTCAEGCGRTSMAVSLEQAVLLRVKHRMRDDAFYEALRTVRMAGVQRANCVKNTGSAMFSFTSLQRALLPNLYKPPHGTFFL